MDLPREVMEFIFEELDSITRKKTARVCKEWMQIIQGSRKFRTHLQIELPSYLVHHGHGHWQPSFVDWRVILRHLVKPGLEAVHFKTHQLPVAVCFESDRHNQIMIEGNELCHPLAALVTAGADLRKVEVVFSGCIVDCAVQYGDRMFAAIRKTRILRSNITAYRWFGISTLYFEELLLEPLEELSEQIVKLFLAECGPLTEAQSEVLRSLETRLAIDAEQDNGHRWAHFLSSYNWGTRYMNEYDWFQALKTIANGEHVSKHTADSLGRSMHMLLKL